MGDYICLDGTIPVSQLAPVLGRIGQLADSYGLRVANVFHAGDGNMHPLILFDANSADGLHKAEALGADILRLCVEMGCQLTYSEMALGMPLLQGVKADWTLMKAHESEIAPPAYSGKVPLYDNTRDLRFGAQISRLTA